VHETLDENGCMMHEKVFFFLYHENVWTNENIYFFFA